MPQAVKILLGAGASLICTACATPSNEVLTPYRLSNGAELQDVVTIAGDRKGGAPSLTVITTYDVTQPNQVVLVSREYGAGQPIGHALAQGLSFGVPIAAGAIAASAVRRSGDTLIQETNYSTQGNVSYGGDAGDIDAAHQAVGTCSGEQGCSVSN